MAREAMHMSASVKGKQQNKFRQLQSSRNSVLIISHIPFGIVACTLIPSTFLKVAVYLAFSVRP